MMYEFHPLAARELNEVVNYYESLASGKGLELASQIKQAIYRICEFPELAPVVRNQVRGLLIQPSSRWHFTLYYRIQPDRIRILALAHQTRSPFYWLRRI